MDNPFSGLPFRQLIRYGIVGVLTNLAGYLVYLLVTALWLSPIAAVAILYPIGALAGYFAHRRHTFQQRDRGLEGAKLVKYAIAYIAGYIVNIAMLYIFYERLNFPHQLVQLSVIFILVGFLFVSLKYFVFIDDE